MIKKLILGLILSIGFPVYAMQVDEQLSTLLQRFNTMTANFSQINYDDSGQQLQASDGTMAIQRPDKFRWYAKTPTEQLIIANGKRLWIYDIDLEQASLKHLDPHADTSPAMLLRGSIDTIKSSYHIKALKGSSGKQGFRLQAINGDNMFQQIDLWFINDHIAEMHIIDNLRQLTKIQFTQVMMNQALPANDFKLNLAADVDVIEE